MSDLSGSRGAPRSLRQRRDSESQHVLYYVAEPAAGTLRTGRRGSRAAGSGAAGDGGGPKYLTQTPFGWTWSRKGLKIWLQFDEVGDELCWVH